MSRALRIGLLVLVGVSALYAFRGPILRALIFRPSEPPTTQRGLRVGDLPDGTVSEVARDLEIPWDLEFLPDGDLLVTERPGRLVRIGDDDRRVYAIEGVRHVGEGGLMGLSLHPEFQRNRWIYLSYTAQVGGANENRVERYRLDEGGPRSRELILGGIPAAPFHDGGRIEFGPDSLLYITTGDAGNPGRAQDRGSLSGKILRLTAEGEVPPGNPFGSPVFSYGHRNPQGLAWDMAGRLWITEHGRSGFQSGLDEINRVEAGRNYGWPEIQGDASAPGMVSPVLHSGPAHTWAPAGAAYWNGSLFFGGLRGEALYELRIEEDGEGELRAHFVGEFGRIRDVRVGPDGMLYFTTSNRDGRGRPRDADDRILRIDPAALRQSGG